MSNQTVKSKIIDNVLVAMSHYVAQGVLKVLEQIIVEELANVRIEEMNTLPAETRRSIDEQNEYIVKLFIYKKASLKDGTKRGYLSAVRRLILETDKALTEVDSVDIFRYLNNYEKRNVANGGNLNQATTINNERRFLSAFYTWMRKEKLISDNPVESIEARKVVKKPIDYFKAEEIEKLREGCISLRDRAIVEVLRSTGARVGELTRIDRYQINWLTGDILICGEKGDRYRTLYLDIPARHHLRKYLKERVDENPALFVGTKTKKELATCGIRYLLKNIADRTDMECRVYPHKMRKTLGMDLKNKGVDIGTIQEIMGHADPAVTAIYYAQSTPEKLRQVREQMAA